MCRDSPNRIVIVLAALLLGSIGSVPVLAAPGFMTKRVKIELEIQPLNAAPASADETLPRRAVIMPGESTEAAVVLAWPDSDSRSTLTIRAVEAPPGIGHAHAVRLDARLDLPGGPTVHSERLMRFDDEDTVLFEVYRRHGQALTVAVKATATEELVFTVLPTVGAAVGFRLEIVRVLAERSVSLETNVLNTLVGEPVSYSFQLDTTPEADSATITLRPVELHGEIATIDIEVSGKLPLGDDLVVIGRNERWAASRGSTFKLAFESGDPPQGYRFLVTARF